MFDALLAAALIQATVPQAPPQTPPPFDDIVVSGLRDIDDPASAVTHKTLGSGRTGKGARSSLQALQLAERFARCAVKDDDDSRAKLRLVLDGVVNGASQRFWQSRFIQQRATCAQDTEIARTLGIAIAAPGYGTSYYERGALFIRALQVFAPDLRLTERDTADPAVQARFDAREIPLARFRLSGDRSYFEIAVCLVRLQPQLASRLPFVEKPDAVARIEASKVNGARICAGNARRVYFDPSQFRFYIADAVYRWAVAARGADSLIPPSAPSPRAR